jgi:hypothetical protein
MILKKECSCILYLTNAQMKGHHKFNISQPNNGNQAKFVHL